MNILVTGANGQLGNEMRIISKKTSYAYSGGYPFSISGDIRSVPS